MTSSFRNVLLLSALLKLVFAVLFADLEPRYDEAEYLNYAKAIHDRGEPPHLWRAPGYQVFLAAGLALAGGKTVGVRLLQVVLSVATSWMVYRMGRRRWGERAGFWAGAFLAFYPSHVAFSHLLWSETLYTFLVVAAADRLLAADRTTGRVRDALLAGVFLGFATLTRSLGIPLLAASLAWLLWGRWSPRSIARAGALLVAAAVVILPWTIYASRRAGQLVPTDLNGGFNFWLGHDEYIPADLPSNWIVGIDYDTDMGSRFHDFLPDSGWRTEIFYRLAQRGIEEPFGPEGVTWFRADAERLIAEDPGGALRRGPLKMAALWAPDFFLPRHLVRDWYGEAPRGLVIALVLVTWLTACVPLIGGPAGLAAMRPDRFRTLTVFWILTYLVVHGLAYGHTRMHQPLVPFLLLALAAVLFDRDEPPLASRFFSRGLPAASLALAAWVVAYPVMVTVYLVPNGRHTSLVRGLALGRNLPVPAAHRLDWLAAGAEFSAAGLDVRSREKAADTILASSRAADHPWTWYLRGWISSDPARAEEFFREALDDDPVHYPALEMLSWLVRERGDTSEATRLERRLLEARPWLATALEEGRLFVKPPAWRNSMSSSPSFPPPEWRRRGS